MRLSMDGMAWSICELLLTLGTTFPTFYQAIKKHCPDFFINLTFTSFEGSFISIITHMKQSVAS